MLRVSVVGWKQVRETVIVAELVGGAVVVVDVLLNYRQSGFGGLFIWHDAIDQNYFPSIMSRSSPWVSRWDFALSY